MAKARVQHDREDGAGGGRCPAGEPGTRGGGRLNGGARRVLLVEDDDDCRAVYRTILEHGGFEVIQARTGAEALTLARQEVPDLILMDVAIPVVDGWEATRILKSAVTTRHIPILALTARALTTDGARAVEVGCDGFLGKPVPPRVVLDTVRAVLGELVAPPAG